MTVLASTGGKAEGMPVGDPSSILADRPLISAARSGDRAALARLYERHAPMVNGVLLARVGRGEAEDLVQEVFLRAMSKLETLHAGAPIGPWLAAIARNLVADAGRAKVRAGKLRLVAAGDEVSEAHDGPALGVDEVLTAIRALPEAYRETVMLRLVEQMTGPQIADRLGLTHGSVRVNLCRGMKMLRESLGDRLGMDGGR